MFFKVCQENLLLGIGSLQLVKYSAAQSLSSHWASNFKFSPYICYNLCCVGSPSMMVLTVKRSLLTILTPNECTCILITLTLLMGFFFLLFRNSTVRSAFLRIQISHLLIPTKYLWHLSSLT